MYNIPNYFQQLTFGIICRGKFHLSFVEVSLFFLQAFAIERSNGGGECVKDVCTCSRQLSTYMYLLMLSAVVSWQLYI